MLPNALKKLHHSRSQGVTALVQDNNNEKVAHKRESDASARYQQVLGAFLFRKDAVWAGYLTGFPRPV